MAGMAPRKQPRDKATGQFKAKALPPRRRRPPAAPGPVSGVVNPFRMAVEQQGWLAGHGAGWWISDHLEELRHFVSWIYVGVHKVGQQWAQSTVNVYDKSAEDVYGANAGLKALFGHRAGHVAALANRLRRLRTKSAAPDAPAEHRTPLPDHPAARLLDEPNPYTAGRTFRYQVACQLRLTGGCYIWEVPNQFESQVTRGLYEPEHLWVIPRGWCRPFAPTPVYPEGGFTITPVFTSFTRSVVSPSVTTWSVPAEQMITVGYPNPLYPGEFTSPLAACSRIIDIMEQTETATWSSFVNAVRPSMVVNIDPRNGQTVTEAMLKQVEDQIQQFKAGANNAGKVLFALGLTVQELMKSPSELDFVEGRQQNRENVLAIQGVAPVVAGLPGASSYSEAAVQAKTTVEFGIAPDLDLFADRLTKRWQRVWGRDFGVVFDPKNYDDPTLKLQRIDKVGQAFQAGVASANEYRAELELSPLEDPIAEIPKVLLEPMVAAPGGPEPGVPGMGDAQDPYAAFTAALTDQADAADELATETSTGQKRPELQAASGNGKPKAFYLNGHGRL